MFPWKVKMRKTPRGRFISLHVWPIVRHYIRDASPEYTGVERLHRGCYFDFTFCSELKCPHPSFRWCLSGDQCKRRAAQTLVWLPQKQGQENRAVAHVDQWITGFVKWLTRWAWFLLGCTTKDPVYISLNLGPARLLRIFLTLVHSDLENISSQQGSTKNIPNFAYLYDCNVKGRNQLDLLQQLSNLPMIDHVTEQDMNRAEPQEAKHHIDKEVPLIFNLI